MLMESFTDIQIDENYDGKEPLQCSLPMIEQASMGTLSTTRLDIDELA